MWDACAVELAAAGVTSVAVDLRGHGRSHEVPGPFDTDTAADDVAALVGLLREQGLATGPVVLAGQSWGGNVVLRAAARHGARDRVVDALALVDGGWLRFDRDEPFEVLWERLAPPTWDGASWDDLVARLEGFVGGWGPHAVPAVLANLTREEDGRVRNVLSRQAHESILRSMYEADPREDYPVVQVPVLLAPAGSGRSGTLLDEAVDALAHPVLRRYPDAHHDLHLQHPEQLAGDLLALLDLARTTGPARAGDPTGRTDPTTDQTTDRTHEVHEDPA